METLDLLVLRQLLDWRRAGRKALLATVTRTWGSSPRPVGAILALCEGGEAVGSVSGGCIEDDLIHRFGTALPDAAPPRTLCYGLTADEAHRFGLPCGGTLELVLEFNPGAGLLRHLVQRLDAGEEVVRHLSMRDGAVQLAPRPDPAVVPRFDGHEMVNVFGPGWRLLLIGAGPLAGYLAGMAAFNGFAVTVCDPREGGDELAGLAPARRVRGMPDDEVLAFAPDARTAIVALTHDPKLDDLALLEALRSPAFYVGAIGSRRNQSARRQRLAEHFGLNEAELARLRGPVGLAIGSRTPAEIAVSVMAELIAVRNGVIDPPPGGRDARSACDAQPAASPHPPPEGLRAPRAALAHGAHADGATSPQPAGD